jgi:transposase-like protein
MAILESLQLEVIWSGPVSLVQKVIVMAKMVLHVLDPEAQINVSQLAQEAGVSRETLYEWGYQAIAVLGMACLPKQRGRKRGVEPLRLELGPSAALSEQVAELRQDNDRLRQENQDLREQVVTLSTELKELVDKAIVVLRLSGKVSYRGIQECLELLFGVAVSHSVISAKLSEAAEQAETVLPSLLGQVQVKLAGLDEVYLKEKGRRVYGLLKRATDRTSDTWQVVIEALPQAQQTLQGLVSDLARAFPALVRKLRQKWQRPLQHQVCIVHTMRKLYEFTTLAWKPYRLAQQRYQQAKQALSKAPDDQQSLTEYWSARQLRNFHWRMARYALTLTSHLVAALRQPTRQAAEAALDKTLAGLAQLPTDYQPFTKKVTTFINRYRPKLFTHYHLPGLDWTTNSCEGAFSVLRRFVTVYKAFPSQHSLERFFTLFVLYYNLKPQHYPDGAYLAPLVRAGVTIDGNYLHYLGYQTPQPLIPYSKLNHQTTQTSPKPILQLSTKFHLLPLAA